MTGKQLRNSILQWAIQGKLVPQDPNDEPASVLLERIRAEKARLIKEKKIKRDKNETIIYRGEDNSYYEKMPDGTVRCIDFEIPFEIPDSWVWCRVSNIFILNPKNNNEDDDMAAFIPMEMINACYGSSYTYKEVKWKSIKNGYTHFSDGDIAFAKITPCFQNRKSAVFENLPNGIGAGTTELKVLRPYVNTVNPYYLLFFLETPYFVEEASFKGTANQQRIISGYLEGKLFPLPPKAEQDRIVKQVQQLLPLTDKYESAFEANLRQQDSINTLLRKSILQEAIQGKLVPRLESEGTAEELLAEIAEEKKRLVKDGKLKKSALTASRIFRGDDNRYHQNINGEDIIIDDFLPFEIPSTWRWISLGELVADRTGLSYKKENLSDRTEPFIRVLRGGNIEDGELIMKADDVFISSSYVAPDLLLKKGQYISPAVSSLEKIGKTAIIMKDYKDTVVGGFVLMLLPLFDDEWLGQYLYYFFQTGYYHNYCRTITKKSGQAFYNLSRPKLKLCPVPLPPKQEIARIVERLNIALAGIMSR